MRMHSSQKRAFSLLELLVVILIIGIIAIFVTPAVGTMLKGSQLSQAEQIITEQIKYARQIALTRNHNVEVRFIRYGDPEAPGELKNDPSTGFYRALQIFDVLDNGVAVPVDKPVLLPQAIVIAKNELSTLVSHLDVQPPRNAAKEMSKDSKGNDVGGDPAMPRGIDWNYQYVKFRFLPDGSTNLNSTTSTVWCITLHNINDKPSGTVPPPNFFTLQLDPVSGTVRLFRPSV